MENKVVDFLQLSANSDMIFGSTNIKSNYVSLIKIHGKSILPPVINEEKKAELLNYKKKAIEKEQTLASQKKKQSQKTFQIPSEGFSTSNISPQRHSTPTRPASLNLKEKISGKTFVLFKAKTDDSLDELIDDESLGCAIIPSQKSSKNIGKTIKSSLEQKLASEDCLMMKNKSSKYQQSPIIEEKYIEIDSDTKLKGRKRWSPLKIDTINSLKIVSNKMPNQLLHDTDDNLDMSVDESQTTPDTVTQSPNLMRQNSYTVLAPSPALLNFLESQRKVENIQRSHSGRKTWDLSKAKKKWVPTSADKKKSPVEVEDNQEQFLSKKNSSSLDSFSALHRDPDYRGYPMLNTLEYDSGTSPDSYSNESVPKLAKIKCKLKTKKVRSLKSLPSPKTVPFKDLYNDAPRVSLNSTPLEVQSELSDLSSLFLKMKVDHERQKKELEAKQESEMKKLEIIFQRKEAEILSKVNKSPKKHTRFIYSQSSRDLGLREPDAREIGDGNHNRVNREKSNSVSEHCLNQFLQTRRPHSAKDFHFQFYSNDEDRSRRSKSIDFNPKNQDTDVDVSFQDDFIQSKDTTLNNDYIIESDSISNFSSQSSVSSDYRHDMVPECSLKKFQGLSSEEFEKYNQAATIITAAARGFLTRRLLRTAHVQGLITTLRDAILCATQLHSASDFADSDIDLMRRLSRQIEAAWDAVYAVFFNTETSVKLQFIAADRERLRAAITKTSDSTVKKKRISSATKKLLDRKKGGSIMSKSQTSNGFSRVRTCTKMAASYPSPYFPQKLK